jgi:hypothetical protein
MTSSETHSLPSSSKQHQPHAATKAEADAVATVERSAINMAKSRVEELIKYIKLNTAGSMPKSGSRSEGGGDDDSRRLGL